MTIATDSAAGGDLPASVDEVVSTVLWERTGGLHQEVTGHRTRLLIPLPYTLATIFQRPWVIPHLYGSSLYSPFAGPRALSPFGIRGPEVYQYIAEDTVVIQVQGQRVSLVLARGAAFHAGAGLIAAILAYEHALVAGNNGAVRIGRPGPAGARERSAPRRRS